MRIEATLDRCAFVNAWKRGKIGDLRADIGHELLAGPMQNFPVTLIIGVVTKIELAAKLREKSREIEKAADRSIVVGNTVETAP